MGGRGSQLPLFHLHCGGGTAFRPLRGPLLIRKRGSFFAQKWEPLCVQKRIHCWSKNGPIYVQTWTPFFCPFHRGCSQNWTPLFDNFEKKVAPFFRKKCLSFRAKYGSVFEPKWSPFLNQKWSAKEVKCGAADALAQAHRAWHHDPPNSMRKKMWKKIWAGAA